MVNSVTKKPNSDEKSDELLSDEVDKNTVQIEIDNIIQLNIGDIDTFDNITINENLYIPWTSRFNIEENTIL